MSDKTSITSLDSKSWQVAKGITQGMGFVPGSFSTAVRTLVSDHLKNSGKIKGVTKYQIARLLKTPSFKPMLYFASKGLYPEVMQQKKSVSVGTMMEFFGPFDLAAMIGGFLLYRKVRKAIDPKLWDVMSPRMQSETKLGAEIGVAMPDIGVGSGILTGLVHHAGIAFAAQMEPAHWKKYSAHLKASNLSLDFDKEFDLWGCTSVQIGVFLLSNLGFGTDVGNALSIAFDNTISTGSLNEAFKCRLRFCRLWIEGMQAGKDQPRIKIPVQYYPTTVAAERLRTRAKQLDSGTIYWLDAQKGDLNPQTAPELFAKSAENADLPQELLDVFSVDEITSMNDQQFDELIDQIDSELESKAPAGALVMKSKEIDDLEAMVE